MTTTKTIEVATAGEVMEARRVALDGFKRSVAMMDDHAITLSPRATIWLNRFRGCHPNDPHLVTWLLSGRALQEFEPA